MTFYVAFLLSTAHSSFSPLLMYFAEHRAHPQQSNRYKSSKSSQAIAGVMSLSSCFMQVWSRCECLHSLLRVGYLMNISSQVSFQRRCLGHMSRLSLPGHKEWDIRMLGCFYVPHMFKRETFQRNDNERSRSHTALIGSVALATYIRT